MAENLQDERKKKSGLWQDPWGYAESFIVSAGLLAVGFILEIIVGKGPGTITYPYNLIAGLVFINILFILHIFYSKKTIVKWLSGVPAAMSSMTLMTFLILLLGVTPQTDKYMGIISDLGLTRLVSSFPYLMISCLLMTTLGLTAIRRSIPFKTKNIGFILNHAGLFIVLFAASTGAGDLQRYSINLEKNKSFNNKAYNETGEYAMRVALKLDSFLIELHPPKLLIADAESGVIIDKKGKTFVSAETGVEGDVADWQVKVIKYYPDALPDSTHGFIEKKCNGAVPAAYIEAIDKTDKHTIRGWVSAGSYSFDPVFLSLNKKINMVMATPEVKRYRSDVSYITMDGNKGKLTLEVNKPKEIGNWKVYQSGYDSSMGKYSNISIIELIYDPWLPVIYLGIALMLIGAIYIFWIGKNAKQVQTDNNTINLN